jgi:hypothetical protein
MVSVGLRVAKRLLFVERRQLRQVKIALDLSHARHVFDGLAQLPNLLGLVQLAAQDSDTILDVDIDPSAWNFPIPEDLTHDAISQHLIVDYLPGAKRQMQCHASHPGKLGASAPAQLSCPPAASPDRSIGSVASNRPPPSPAVGIGEVHERRSCGRAGGKRQHQLAPGAKVSTLSTQGNHNYLHGHHRPLLIFRVRTMPDLLLAGAQELFLWAPETTR